MLEVYIFYLKRKWSDEVGYRDARRQQIWTYFILLFFQQKNRKIRSGKKTKHIMMLRIQETFKTLMSKKALWPKVYTHTFKILSLSFILPTIQTRGWGRTSALKLCSRAWVFVSSWVFLLCLWKRFHICDVREKERKKKVEKKDR